MSNPNPLDQPDRVVTIRSGQMIRRASFELCQRCFLLWWIHAGPVKGCPDCAAIVEDANLRRFVAQCCNGEA